MDTLLLGMAAAGGAVVGAGPGLPLRQSMTEMTREPIHRNQAIQLKAQLALMLLLVPPSATMSDMLAAAACAAAGGATAAGSRGHAAMAAAAAGQPASKIAADAGWQSKRRQAGQDRTAHQPEYHPQGIQDKRNDAACLQAGRQQK